MGRTKKNLHVMVPTETHLKFLSKCKTKNTTGSAAIRGWIQKFLRDELS